MGLGLWQLVDAALANVQIDGHGKGVSREELAAMVYAGECERTRIAENLVRKLEAEIADLRNPPRSSNGRTADSDPANRGSTPRWGTPDPNFVCTIRGCAICGGKS